MSSCARQWDIFCAVIDNFGDIGICWRLSKQLALEHHINVRLWVDDLVSFKKICPAIDTALTSQTVDNVLIKLWSSDTHWAEQHVADVVIEALACTIPMPYQQMMAALDKKPLWLNLEYLSAEDWVEGCHGLSSPQPHLPLEKYFFFPGFTSSTGALLQERDVQEKALQFNQDARLKTQFWLSLGVENIAKYQRKISLFAYEQAQIAELFSLWQQENINTLCLIPEGVLAKQVMVLYPSLSDEKQLTIGSLTLKILPFIEQSEYDKLLWSCDINFVRGEDSIIRAHWAEKPFIWQIYRQDEEVHLEKLTAFLDKYSKKMPENLKEALISFWFAWNKEENLVEKWKVFSEFLPNIAEYNAQWRKNLTANGDLASNLVRFIEKKFIMRRNFS